MKKHILTIIILALILTGCSYKNKITNGDTNRTVYKKPVIYIYGYDNEDIQVKLDIHDKSTLTCTYPDYNDGWTVRASKDGILTDSDNKTYRYLYWEADTTTDYRITEGFCVKGTNTADFLEEKLYILGLNDLEINDFITYWLPDMQKNAYNIISFDTTQYEKAIKLEVYPEPKNIQRVFMTWYSYDKKISIPEQKLQKISIDRNEPSVIEWGGVRIVNLWDQYKENHKNINLKTLK